MMGSLGAVPLMLVTVATLVAFARGDDFDPRGILLMGCLCGYLMLSVAPVSITLTADRLAFRWFDGVWVRRGSIRADEVVRFETMHPYSEYSPPAQVRVTTDGSDRPHRIGLGTLAAADVRHVLDWLDKAESQRKRRPREAV